MAIANNLKQLRTERNLNQEDLAAAIGSCCRTISRIERGDRNPSLELALRIAAYLELPLEDIFQAYDP
ncbi:MAG: helix-turn-helix transcriptional regulator [Lachnospiraceae bacterium]|nr:helix-turn-helix transcriptional regulator [Lachnospiraceae bacterium]